MCDKKFPEDVNPKRREFLEKVTKGAFILPVVISVMMLKWELYGTPSNASTSNLCLSCETLISTPEGNVPIVDLKPGMSVFTLDMNGTRS